MEFLLLWGTAEKLRDLEAPTYLNSKSRVIPNSSWPLTKKMFVLVAGPHNQQVVSTASQMGTLMCNSNAVAAATRTISALWRMNIVIMLLGSSSLTCLNSQGSDSRIGLNSNQESCVGGQGYKHTSIGDGLENGDMAAVKTLLPLNPQRIPWKKFRVDRRDQDLLLPNLSWDEKVVFTLHMVRRRGLFEYNPKTYYSTLPNRFCQFNIAFFDLDKESDFKREPRFSKIPDSYWPLDSSMNILSIKVSESDVPYPINIYGTVVARDQVDYRCVYLFKRGRDNPQRITSVDDAITLTGPYRALAGDVMVF